MNQILSSIPILNADGKANINSLNYLEAFRSQNWNKLSTIDRINALQHLENYSAKMQGRESRVVKLNPNLQSACRGRYNKNAPDSISLNRNLVNSNDSFQAMATTLHEGRHAYQDDICKGRTAPDKNLNPYDVEKTKANKDVWTKNINDKYYSQKNGYKFSEYRYQPIEADANNYSDDMMEQFGESFKNEPNYDRWISERGNKNFRDCETAKEEFKCQNPERHMAERFSDSLQESDNEQKIKGLNSENSMSAREKFASRIRSYNNGDTYYPNQSNNSNNNSEEDPGEMQKNNHAEHGGRDKVDEMEFEDSENFDENVDRSQSNDESENLDSAESDNLSEDYDESENSDEDVDESQSNDESENLDSAENDSQSEDYNESENSDEDVDKSQSSDESENLDSAESDSQLEDYDESENSDENVDKSQSNDESENLDSAENDSQSEDYDESENSDENVDKSQSSDESENLDSAESDSQLEDYNESENSDENVDESQSNDESENNSDSESNNESQNSNESQSDDESENHDSSENNSDSEDNDESENEYYNYGYGY